MSEYPLAQGHYYGVNYGERGRKGVPKNAQRPANLCRQRVADNRLWIMRPTTSFYANIPVPTSHMCMGSKARFLRWLRLQSAGGHRPCREPPHLARQETVDRAITSLATRGIASDRRRRARRIRPHRDHGWRLYGQPTDFSFCNPAKRKTWSQFWYPIQQIGPAQHANLDAAISLVRHGGKLRPGIAAAQQFAGAKYSAPCQRKETPFRPSAPLRLINRSSPKSNSRAASVKQICSARHRFSPAKRSFPINRSRAS